MDNTKRIEHLSEQMQRIGDEIRDIDRAWVGVKGSAAKLTQEVSGLPPTRKNTTNTASINITAGGWAVLLLLSTGLGLLGLLLWVSGADYIISQQNLKTNQLILNKQQYMRADIEVIKNADRISGRVRREDHHLRPGAEGGSGRPDGVPSEAHIQPREGRGDADQGP